MNASFELPYFPRHGLLAKVLTTYESGLKQGITLFAPRRQGKTSFVKHELLPAVTEAGWQTLYIDLWKRRSEPELGLVEQLEALLDARQSGWRKRLQLKEIKTKVKLPGGEVGATVVPEESQAPETVLENRLTTAMTALVGNRRTLLVIDEVQALAGAKQDNFVASLRTVIQQLLGKLLVFYTGSSRDGLNRMFRKQNAPLFASTMPLQLDDLGDDFLEDRLAFLSSRSPLPVDKVALTEIFEQLGKTPEFLNEVILHLIIAGDGDLDAAMNAWRQSHRDAGAGSVLSTLKPIERALMILLSTPEHPSVYSAEASTQLQAAVGTSVNATKIQNAINRLVKQDLVGPTGTHGDYEIEDRAVLIHLREP